MDRSSLRFHYSTPAMALLLRPSLVFLVLLVAQAVVAQQQQQQPDVDGGCNGILLTYTLQGREKMRPFVSTAESQSQAYSFRANATVRNGGTRALRSWALLVTFAHGEILVGVDGAVLTSGAELPYNTSAAAEDGTSLSGYPQTELLTPIATAGDLSKIQATVNLVGTLFAGPDPYVPLPSALSLADPSYAYACPPATTTNASTASALSTCCVSSATASTAATPSPSSSPRRSGDLVITYDVVQAHDTTYLALVTLDNGAPLGRLDGWQLSWEWQRGESIRAMRGAYPREVGSAACLYGPQGQHYKGLDFSKVLNCDRRPVVMDLPPSRADDADMGRINHCCRNGTILPRSMGVAQSTSAFQMDVYKMPPDLNDRTKLYPPAGFQVRGSSPLNPDYACGQPVPVRPSEFPDPSGLPSTTLAVASWQVVCNITVDESQQAPPKSSTPRCCVSFSAFYNESVVPCRTCACGCPAPTKTSQQPASSCSTTAPAMLLPPYALLMPSDRRAKEALTWADQKELGPVPNPMPCADNCGVSVNWHVASDFAGGWTARLTLFNWQADADMPDWFAAVVMADQAAYDGFEQAYSFNATAIGNATIFIDGREGFNDFLLKETNMSSVDYPVPGKVQSVLSFTKKTSAAIDVIAGDGFPSKVFFNGDECAMPLRIPSAGTRPNTGAFVLPIMLSSCLVASALLLLLL